MLVCSVIDTVLYQLMLIKLMLILPWCTFWAMLIHLLDHQTVFFTDSWSIDMELSLNGSMSTWRAGYYYYFSYAKIVHSCIRWDNLRFSLDVTTQISHVIFKWCFYLYKNLLILFDLHILDINYPNADHMGCSKTDLMKVCNYLWVWWIQSCFRDIIICLCIIINVCWVACNVTSLLALHSLLNNVLIYFAFHPLLAS